MYIIRYVTDKGTRQSEQVTTIESARYLWAEILAHQKPHETEIIALSTSAKSNVAADLLWSLLADEE